MADINGDLFQTGLFSPPNQNDSVVTGTRPVNIKLLDTSALLARPQRIRFIRQAINVHRRLICSFALHQLMSRLGWVKRRSCDPVNIGEVGAPLTK